MKVGLLFGSFNPVHIGHLIIANHFVEFTDIDQVWFVVTPQNPFKKEEFLLDEKQRLKIVEFATDDNDCFVASDVEFFLSKPSYTINTVKFLQNEFPNFDFNIIIGSDNLEEFKDWKDYAEILKLSELYVYQRKGYEKNPLGEKDINIFNFPYVDISATYIRDCLKKKKSVRYLVPERSLRYILKHGLYNGKNSN